MTTRGHLVLVLHDTHLTMSGPRPISIGGLPVFERLATEAAAHGFAFSTSSQWLAAGRPGPAHLLWDFASHAVLPRSMRTPSVASVVAWTLESPLVAHRGYHRLRAISRTAAAVTTFPGARDHLPAGARFEPMHWPNARPRSLPEPARREKLLVLVNSNKQANASLRALPWREPKRAARLAAAAALAASYRLRRTWSAPDLYDERLVAISELGATGELDLYGVGWDRPVEGLAPERQAVVDAVYRGPTPDKQATLAQYRFALIIENTRFPGYITEKIFDAMLAGAVPVYLGAPDVTAYVPPSTFVAVDDFAGFPQLLEHLRAMPDAEVASKQAAARAFLASPDFDRFTEEAFVQGLLDLVLEVGGDQPASSS